MLNMDEASIYSLVTWEVVLGVAVLVSQSCYSLFFLALIFHFSPLTTWFPSLCFPDSGSAFMCVVGFMNGGKGTIPQFFLLSLQ
jgi:hypothetical protein